MDTKKTVFEDKFQQLLKNPIYWYNKSSDLMASAGVLSHSQSQENSGSIILDLGLGDGFRLTAALPGVYLLLCGMSLELLFKAIIVKKNLQIRRNHNLVDQAKDAGVKIMPDEEALLQILTGYIYWAGRYPVPNEPEEYEELANLVQEHLYDRTVIGALWGRKANDKLSWSNFKKFWDRVCNEYLNP